MTAIGKKEFLNLSFLVLISIILSLRGEKVILLWKGCEESFNILVIFRKHAFSKISLKLHWEIPVIFVAFRAILLIFLISLSAVLPPQAQIQKEITESIIDL